jgi:hypothetical protein
MAIHVHTCASCGILSTVFGLVEICHVCHVYYMAEKIFG